MTEPLQPSQRRVEQVLEQGLERIQTPEEARAVVERIEQQCSGENEMDRAQVAAQKLERQRDPSENQTDAAATTIERAAQGPTDADAVAHALETTAAQAVAPTEAAPAVTEAAQAALSPARP